METKIEFRPRLEEAVRKAGGDISEAKRHGLIYAVERVEGALRQEVPVRSGNLASHGISSYVTDNEGVINITARNAAGDNYAVYLRYGTGIYGPKGRPIRPTTKKALYFPGAKHPVKSVKGIKPNDFDDRALRKANVQNSFETGVRNYLDKIGG